MTWESILAVAGGIVLIANAGAAIFKWIAPAFNIRQDVNTLKEHDAKDYETLQHINQINRMQCNLLLCMMNHMIDGNGIKEMKETREKIQKLLNE